MKQKCFDVIRRFRDPYVSDSVVWRQTSNFMSKIQLYTTIEVTITYNYRSHNYIQI
jgi:hypothetical protein